MKYRQYYADFAEALPKDTVILTSGCAKYRYNKLPLGDIDGIPRILDAGQYNDSYSWVVVAMAIQRAFDTFVQIGGDRARWGAAPPERRRSLLCQPGQNIPCRRQSGLKCFSR